MFASPVFLFFITANEAALDFVVFCDGVPILCVEIEASYMPSAFICRIPDVTSSLGRAVVADEDGRGGGAFPLFGGVIGAMLLLLLLIDVVLRSLLFVSRIVSC